MVVVAMPQPDGGGEVLRGDCDPGEAAGLQGVVGGAQKPSGAPRRGQGPAGACGSRGPTRAGCVRSRSREAASRGFRPSSTMLGVPHSLAVMVSWPRCHQKSWANSYGLRSISHRHFSLKGTWSMSKAPRRRTGAVPVRGTQGAYVDTVGTAMEGVRAAVARLLVQLVCFYHLDDLGPGGVMLGVHNVNARRLETGHQQTVARKALPNAIPRPLARKGDRGGALLASAAPPDKFRPTSWRSDLLTARVGVERLRWPL